MDDRERRPAPAGRSGGGGLIAAYERHRRRGAPRWRCPPDLARDPRWAEFDAAVSECGDSPDGYVAWLWRKFRRRQADVWVNQVLSPRMLAEFRAGAEDRDFNAKLAARLQLGVLTSETARGRPLRETLLDEELPVGAAVRLAAARRAGLSELEDGFLEQASEQVRLDPRWRILLAPWLDGTEVPE